MQGLKIGITIAVKEEDTGVWTNGIKLNVFALYQLLKNSNKKYEVFLLNQTKIDASKVSYLNGINIKFFDDVYEQLDLIITIGAQIKEDLLNKFKSIKKDNKVVKYSCSFNYILSMESILFKEESKNAEHQIERCFDEVWYIPQAHESSGGYFHTLYRTNCLIVPFVWHYKNITESIIDINKNYKTTKFKRDYKYDPTRDKKVIGVLEPNINTTKFCLIPAMIAEESYRTETGKNKIDCVMLTNASSLINNKEFLGLLKTFDIFKDKKMTGESRYQTAFILSQYLDIVISHQVSNPLNYLYLDVAYMGYPVLHNAPMCKDIGYYYEGSDTVEGSKMLNWILENHDKNLESYTARTNMCLYRYNADNPHLVETYDKLIYNLYNGGNIGLVYDEMSNNYKSHFIPKKILQLIKDKTIIDPEFQKNIDFLKKMNPTWEHNLLDDNDMLEYIKKNYPSHILNLYNLINPNYGCARADFFRYLYMYKEGGAYFDIKSALSIPLDQFIKYDDEYILSRWDNTIVNNKLFGTSDEFQQWYIICKPNHPFLQNVIKNVSKNILDYDTKQDSEFNRVSKVTGHIVYTQSIEPLLSFYNHRICGIGIKDNLKHSNITKNYRDLYETPHYTKLTEPVVLESKLWGV